MPDPILVIDLGSSNVCVSLVDAEGKFVDRKRVPLPPIIPMEGILEYDPMKVADTVLELAKELAGVSVCAVGITDHRGSSMIWDRKTGVPVGNMLSWQDIRTVATCLELQSQGLRLLPNQSATKLKFLLEQVENPEAYCFGTPESWLTWNLTEGAVHITDATHAGLSGMMTLDGKNWDPEILAILGIPEVVLPQIVNSTEVHANATALPGAPPIAGLVGDQQASLIGQGCIKAGMAKMTFGTGGSLNVCTEKNRPKFDIRGDCGTFPTITWRQADTNFWGIEAIMLNAGSCVDWAIEKLGLANSLDELSTMPDSSSSSSSGKDVKFVPALTGLGTPYWDFGARGIFVGMDLSTDKSQLMTAVLEGIANHAADMCEAALKDTGLTKEGFACMRIDGGMNRNKVFTQALADACGTEIEVSKESECTSLGAAYLAGVAVGVWKDLSATAELYEPATVLSPNPDSNIRQGWEMALKSAQAYYPELSVIEF